MQKHWSSPERIVLKEGARVMLTYNIDLEENLYNGTTGIICGFTPEGLPKFQTDNGNQVVLQKVTCEVKMGNQVLASRTQIPVLLAYAITIHKSQGMSIKNVYVDMNNMFERGMLYVAISRSISLGGLYLAGRIPTQKLLQPDPKVLQWWTNVKTKN